MEHVPRFGYTPPAAAPNLLTPRFGFISHRNLSEGTYLIDSGWGEYFTFHANAIAGNGRCLQFATVRFDTTDLEVDFGGQSYYTATNVTEVLQSLPFHDAPPIRAYVRQFDGKIGVLSFEDYDSKLTLRFFARNLVDRTRPPVGSHVFVHTSVLYKDGRPLTQIYRLRVDLDRLDESRIFVCPTHVTERLAALAQENDLVIYVGEFEKDFEENSTSPFFSTAEMMGCLPEGTYLSDFTFASLVGALRDKYKELEESRKEILEHEREDDADEVALELDMEYTRLTGISRGLRHLGHATKTSLKATVIINPLPYINDVLGTSSRFSWASFASWAATSCTKGPFSLLLTQVLLLRPLNIWVDPANLFHYHSHAEFEIDQSPLSCVLLAPTPVNFGFSCSLTRDTSINFKHSEGLFKIATYIFKAASLPEPVSWPETQKKGRFSFGVIDLSNEMAEAEESGSAHEVRVGPPFRDVKNSFIVTFTKNGTSQSFGAAVQNVRKLLEGWCCPWEVRPTHHDAFTVTPRNAVHGAQLMNGLMDGNNKGLLMCMPLSIYTDTTLEEREGELRFSSSTIVTFFAWEAKPGILIEILGSDVHLLAMDKRTLLVHHHKGTEYVNSRILAANAACTSQRLQPLFHSIQTGPDSFQLLLPKKRAVIPSQGPSAWLQRPNTSRLSGVVLTGLNYSTSENIVQLALDHFIVESGELDKCFVKDACGRVSLLVTGQEESLDVFEAALSMPVFSMDNNSLFVTPVAYDPTKYIKFQNVPVFLTGAPDSNLPPFLNTGEIVLGEKDEQQVKLLREALKITDFFGRLPLVSRVAAAGDPTSTISTLDRGTSTSLSSSSSSSSRYPSNTPVPGSPFTTAASCTNTSNPSGSSSSSSSSSSDSSSSSSNELEAVRAMSDFEDEMDTTDKEDFSQETTFTTVQRNKKKKKELHLETITEKELDFKKSKANVAVATRAGARQRTPGSSRQTDIRSHTKLNDKDKDGKRTEEVTHTRRGNKSSGHRDDG